MAIWRGQTGGIARVGGVFSRCEDCPCDCTCACGNGETVPLVSVGTGLFVSFVATDILGSNPSFSCVAGVCVWSGFITATYNDGANDFAENIYASFQLNADGTWSLAITGQSEYLHPGSFPVGEFSYERTGDMGEGCDPIAIGPEGVYFDQGAGAIGLFDFTLEFSP
jgi:hypothetical protein